MHDIPDLLPIGLRAMHKWFMPHELPAVVCRLLKESAESPMKELTQAAQEAGNKALGSRWNTREDCPSPTPAGASLQAANQELSRINFDTHSRPGYALTQPGLSNFIRPAPQKIDRVWQGTTSGVSCSQRVHG